MATAPQTLRRTAEIHHWQAQLIWIVAAGVIGFADSWLFSGVLEMSRNWWLVIHVSVVAAVVYSYARWAGIDVLSVARRHWVAGVVVGAVVVALITFLIVRTQTASPRDQGLTFVWDIVWLGVVYGTADALLLNVLPVYAVWQASKELGHADSWTGKIGTLAVAMVASMLVTVMYHAGFSEFQSTQIIEPIKGNAIVTIGYLLSGNPITAIFGHIALHVSSVVHGITSTVSLPPHY